MITVFLPKYQILIRKYHSYRTFLSKKKNKKTFSIIRYPHRNVIITLEFSIPHMVAPLSKDLKKKMVKYTFKREHYSLNISKDNQI